MKFRVTIVTDPDDLFIIRTVQEVEVLSDDLLFLWAFLEFGDEPHDLDAVL